MQNRVQVDAIAQKFEIYGNYLGAAPYGSGHINDTFLGLYNQAGKKVRYIFQRINTSIFKNPEDLMRNISVVLSHLKKKNPAGKEASRYYLTLVPTKDKKKYYVSPDGSFWRCYLFIEGAVTYDILETEEHAYQAAYAFGIFQRQLSDLDGSKLVETIPNFHNTVKRLETFDAVLKADVCRRAASVRPEIEFVQARRGMVSTVVDMLADGRLPVRITHNDTKLNNVMIDETSGQGICVIDLDTVMPGSSLYDFGDMVRTSVSPAAEDEKDLSKVVCRLEMFRALVHGFTNGFGDCLTKTELELLPFSGRLITFEIGLRFLTDYLDGDHYFKVHRDGHNVDRCRTQFKLVSELERLDPELQNIMKEFAK